MTTKYNHAAFLIVIALLAISCSNKTESNHARIIWDKYKNGNYRTVYQYLSDSADMSKDYYYQEFYENGNLKIQGLENQRFRMGEWKVYYDNGDLMAKMTFENNLLNGPVELYEKNGSIKAKDIAKDGHLYANNSEVKSFINGIFGFSENRIIWNDSLDFLVDSLETILKKY